MSLHFVNTARHRLGAALFLGMFGACSFLALPIVRAQTPPVPDRLSHDWRAAVDDAAVVFSAPAHWDAGQWAVAGLVAGAAAVAVTQDESVRNWSQDQRSDSDLDRWLKVGDYYGGGVVGAVTGAAMYGGGMAFDDEWTRVTGRMVLQSILYAGAVNSAMKMLLGRARPYSGEGAGAFHLFRIDNDHLSMPSGHCTQAFALSSTLSARIDHPAAYAALYALAAVTAAQRIVDDKHWLSDTIVGSALGVAVGLAVVHLEDERVGASPSQIPISAGMHPHLPLFRWTMSF